MLDFGRIRILIPTNFSILETFYFAIFCTSVVPADCRAEWRRHPADWWRQRRPVRRGAPPPCWFATWISQTRKSPLKTGHQWKHSFTAWVKSKKAYMFWRDTVQCCRSGMFITDRGSWLLSISDFGFNKINKRGWGEICCPSFFCGLKVYIIVKYFIFEQVKKLSQLIKIYSTFTQQLSLNSQKYGFGIRDPTIQYPGYATLIKYKIKLT